MRRKLLTALLLLLAAGNAALAQWDRDVFMFRGRQALSDGKYAAAIENFNVLARLDSTDYWTFFFRGIAKYDLGDLRGAGRDFSTSVRLNPVFTEGYRVRAMTFNRTGDYEKALEDLQRALELRPGMNSLYYSRALTYYFSHRYEEAVGDFDLYIRRDPTDAGAYTYRGDAYLALGDTLKAMRDYDKAIETDRFDANAYLHRGGLHSDLGDHRKGIEDLDKAIALDSASTFFHFHRGLMYAKMHDFKAAIADLDEVLKADPGNSLTLYNRSLMYAQVGEYEKAVDDMDRVINVNPRNVLAYFNRAGYFMSTGKWHDALADYDSAIELYPDFAKAYMNRSYVKNMLGRKRESKRDYETARQKVREYEEKNAAVAGTFADTTRAYSSFISFDADFARKDFDDELLQHRDVDIRLKPMFKFRMASRPQASGNILGRGYESALIERFRASVPVILVVNNADTLKAPSLASSLDFILSGDSSEGAGRNPVPPARAAFVRGIYEVQNKQYNSALGWFDKAVKLCGADGDKDPYAPIYQAFYLMNRGVLRSEMTDLIASIESKAGTLKLDGSGSARLISEKAPTRTYDRSEAISDLEQAAALLPDIPYIWFNLGNLYCLSSRTIDAISSYDRAIGLYPYMGDAYFNRGLVLIYLKDKEKGCIDMSRAGELGVSDAYRVIDKYCRREEM